VHRLERPVLAAGEALVDRAEVAREQRGLLAAGAGTDLDDAVAAVVATFGQQVVDQRVVLFGRTAFEDRSGEDLLER
jgi:hypothetical protein